MPREIPEPWGGFLGDLNDKLRASIDLHCLGGFVVSIHYGCARPTADIDFLTVVPRDGLSELLALAGANSPLHKKHRVYLQLVTVTTCPDDYAARLIEMFPGRFKKLRLLALDPYDLALSKLERNAPRDREDVFALAKRVPLDTATLSTRYQEEMRSYLGNPEREDLTLRLWIDVIEEERRR